MDPLHITEFASERYFSKLKQLRENAEDGAASAAAAASSATTTTTTTTTATTTTATAAIAPLPQLHQTFTLPLGNPRYRPATDDDTPLVLRPSEQKKRSLGHDLSTLRTQRRPTFSGSFGSLRSKVTVISKSSSTVEHHKQILAEDPTAPVNLNLSDLFLALPNELQAHIIAPLPIHTILNLRRVSKSFHTLITLNESPISRYHVTHSLPAYTLRLYPLPDPTDVSLHYLCSIWHRLHVALKLSTMIAAQATKEIFLRVSDVQRQEFEPQHRRMRQRLVPLIFTLFHFFETYRDLHLQHLKSDGTPLHRQPYTLNPVECQVMAMYDDQTLLKVHQVFPLVISSFSRRLRPPSYAGRLERSIKGYLKDRPADEVYATVIAIGGLRQAQRFWETKGYNARRAAVDAWYGLITRTPVEAAPKSKMSRITHLGRKKHVTPAEGPPAPDPGPHDAATCNEWFCVKPSCQASRRRHSTDNLVFHSSLSAGPPMSPLSREQLRIVLPDLQHLSNIWMHTAEALILERRIVERPQDIKRNTQVLLELIRDDGTDGMEDWAKNHAPIPMQTVNAERQEGMGDPGGVSD